MKFLFFDIFSISLCLNFAVRNNKPTHLNNENQSIQTNCLTVCDVRKYKTKPKKKKKLIEKQNKINSCGEGRVMSTDQKGCMDRNECLDLPCLNGASCINLEPKLRYRCVCLDGFWGENCELIQEGQTLKLSMSALAAILVCLLVILSEHQISLILSFL